MDDILRDALLKLSFKDKLQLVRDYNNALKENYPIECSLKQLVEQHRICASNQELLEAMKNIALNISFSIVLETLEYGERYF